MACCRKNLLTASTAGHHVVGAEAQLRSKGANPINIHSSAELRRPSNASVASVNGSIAANPVAAAAAGVSMGATPGIGAGAGVGVGVGAGAGLGGAGIGPGVLGGLSVTGGSSDGLEGHVPHMICKSTPLRLVCFCLLSLCSFPSWNILSVLFPPSCCYALHRRRMTPNPCQFPSFMFVFVLFLVAQTFTIFFFLCLLRFLVLPIAPTSGARTGGGDDGMGGSPVWRGGLGLFLPRDLGLHVRTFSAFLPRLVSPVSSPTLLQSCLVSFHLHPPPPASPSAVPGSVPPRFSLLHVIHIHMPVALFHPTSILAVIIIIISNFTNAVKTKADHGTLCEI